MSGKIFHLFIVTVENYIQHANKSLEDLFPNMWCSYQWTKVPIVGSPWLAKHFANRPVPYYNKVIYAGICEGPTLHSVLMTALNVKNCKTKNYECFQFRLHGNIMSKKTFALLFPSIIVIQMPWFVLWI